MVAGHRRVLGKLVLLLDAVIVLVSMGLAFWLHGPLRALLPWLKAPPGRGESVYLLYLTLPVFLVLVALLRLNRLDERPGTKGLFLDLLKLHGLALLGLALLLFLTQNVINRSLVGLFMTCNFTLLYLGRHALLGWRGYQHRSGTGRLRLLLVGRADEPMRRFAARAALAPLPPRLLGYLAPAGDEGPAPPGLRRLGSAGELPGVLHDEAVDRVLFFPPLHRPADVPGALSACEALGIPADFAVVLEPSATPPRLLEMHGQPFVALEPLTRPPAALLVKQGLDLLLSAMALLLMAPLLLLVAAAIRVTMGSPVLFVQRRTGVHGRTFKMYKFRTMRPGAEAEREELLAENEMSGPVFKSRSDPRVTPLGRVLRRTSLDELPQLINVLKGEMSLVGPRPLPVQEQHAIHGLPRRRLSMKPGITGLWQVSGRNAVDFDDWMRLDLEYVDGWSLALDLRILLRTIPAVLTRRGAS